MQLNQQYSSIREQTVALTAPLKAEDFSAQPVVDVSPPKWHLAHTTWFFETFVLKPHANSYTAFHPDYNYLFNSYYETVGQRVVRHNRGFYTRPTVEEVLKYRQHVDECMQHFLQHQEVAPEVAHLIQLGLNHEQQHQELLLTDLKFILFQAPLYPAYRETDVFEELKPAQGKGTTTIKEGVYEIGYNGNDFHFDNERSVHKRFIEGAEIINKPVTFGDYLAFVEEGGYEQFQWWLSDAWSWLQENAISHPLYWVKKEEKWFYFSLHGLVPLPSEAPMTHLSYYEAEAFAEWSGKRLPTEFEWEVASAQLPPSNRWEWTQSAYLPYPRYQKAKGAIGEYNGKFMVNQMVLRGGSIGTPKGHTRATYRNFFHPYLQWQFAGIRLVNT